MSIIIKRSTNFIGIAVPLKIKVDGRKVDKIYHEEEKEIEIGGPVAEIGVSHFLSRASKITIYEGEYVEIRSTLWRSLSMMIFFILLSIVVLGIQTELYKALGFIGLFVYAFIAEYGFEHFHLKKVEFEEERHF